MRTHAVYAPLAGGLGIIAILVVLQKAVSAGLISPWIMPPPSEVVNALVGIISSGTALEPLARTAGAVGATLALVLIVGIPVGLFLYTRRGWGAASEGILSNLFAVPMVLLFPVFLVIFGRNYFAITLCAFVHCVIPVIIYTREGLLAVPQVFLNVGKIYRLTSSAMFWKIMLPYALPTIFMGIRLSVIYLLVYVVGIEFLVSYGGLGAIIADYYMRFDVVNTYAAISLVVLLSMSFYFGLRGSELCLRRLR